jgi:hypothetical protein
MSRNEKLLIYKTIIRPLAMYACETWVPTKGNERALNIWERKIMRKIYGPINEWGIMEDKDKCRTPGRVRGARSGSIH